MSSENPFVLREAAITLDKMNLPAQNRVENLKAQLGALYEQAGVETYEEYFAAMQKRLVSRNITPEQKANLRQAKKLMAELAELAKTGKLRQEQEPREFTELREEEAEKLAEFFGKDIEVPPLPDYVTVEMMKNWERLGIELHYIPNESLVVEVDGKIQPRRLAKWKKKPNDWLYDSINNDNIARESAQLRPGWIMIEKGQKPNYKEGKQHYPGVQENERDFLEPVLEKLNKPNKPNEQGVIQQRGWDKKPLPAYSRFGLSAEDLEKPDVVNAFREALGIQGIKQIDLSQPRAIEFNFIGNLHHPEWGDTNTWEWFADDSQDGQHRLVGGDADGGGLSYIDWLNRDKRTDYGGFRLLGRFT